MTRQSLKSSFGEQIRAFVGYKNSLGFFTMKAAVFYGSLTISV